MKSSVLVLASVALAVLTSAALFGKDKDVVVLGTATPGVRDDAGPLIELENLDKGSLAAAARRINITIRKQVRFE